MTAASAVIHFGTHKTGSTSLQGVLHRQRAELDRRGFHVLKDSLASGGQSWDLATVCIRRELDAPFRQLLPQTLIPSVHEASRQAIREQVLSDAPVLIGSMECLSLIREPAEVQRLKDLLAPRTVRCVVVRRNARDFLESYGATLTSLGIANGAGLPRDSACYVAPGSWVADVDSLVRVLSESLGDEAVEVVDYDEQMSARGDVLPAVWQAIGLPDELLDETFDAPAPTIRAAATPLSLPGIVREMERIRGSRLHRAADALSRALHSLGGMTASRQ